MKKINFYFFSKIPILYYWHRFYFKKMWNFAKFQRLIAELNKEQEAFIASKQTGEKGEAVAPWVGAPNEDALREECLSLSTVSDFRFHFPLHVKTWEESVEIFEKKLPVSRSSFALQFSQNPAFFTSLLGNFANSLVNSWKRLDFLILIKRCIPVLHKG